jgi:hypothetical protein
MDALPHVEGGQMPGSALDATLGQEGWRVAQCEDAASARLALVDHALVAVLLDLGLPGGSGLDALTTMHDRYDPTHQSSPRAIQAIGPAASIRWPTTTSSSRSSATKCWRGCTWRCYVRMANFVVILDKVGNRERCRHGGKERRSGGDRRDLPSGRSRFKPVVLQAGSTSGMKI